MSDTDAFVKRMLARNEARRAKMSRLGEGPGSTAEKENSNNSQDKTPISKHKNTADNDEVLVNCNAPAAPPLPKASPTKLNTNLIPTESNNDLYSITTAKETTKSSTISVSSHSVSKSKPLESISGNSVPSVNNPRQAAGGRLTALARRRQQMQEWDDDYTYHSTSTSQGNKVSHNIASPSNHASSSTKHQNPSSPAKHDSPSKYNKHLPSTTNETFNNPPASARKFVNTIINNKTDGSSSSPVKQYSSSKKSSSASSIPQYIFGESPTLSPAQKHAIEFSMHKPRYGSTDLDAVKVLPTGDNASRQDMSPTTKMFWDRKLINSLEAQGFTPTQSHSRLVYDFRKEQEDAVEFEGIYQSRASNEQIDGPARPSSPVKYNSGSPSKSHNSVIKPYTSPNKATTSPIVTRSSPVKESITAPPKILSCVMKNPNPPQATSMRQRRRSPSPGGVSELRSRWEQQIRESSPDRQTSPTRRERSVSPVKTQQTTRSFSPSKTHNRPASPVKDYRYASPLKDCRPVSPVDYRPVSPVKDYRPVSPVKDYRPVSPVKDYRPASPVKDYRPASPVKDYRPASPVKDYTPSSPVKDYTPSSPIKDYTPSSPVKDYRPVSPAKFEVASSRPVSPTRTFVATSPAKRYEYPQSAAGNGTKVVKGVCPMPPTVPVMDEPHQSSVLARAAAFTLAMDAVPTSPAIDPAHLSLQGRRQLFEKKGEDPLLPRAPFGQPIPTKMLGTGSGSVNIRPGSSARHVKARPISYTPGTAVSRCRDALESASSTACSSSVRDQVTARHAELHALHNRFPGRHAAAHDTDGTESDSSEYPESVDEQNSSACSSETASDILMSPGGGPPKPPRVYVDHESPVMPPPAPKGRASPAKDARRGSPTKSFEPRIRPGCLYPGLSDIESQSEVDPDEPYDVSMCSSVATCASGESLGAKIQKVAHGNRQPDLATLPEDTKGEESISAALDEAFSDEEEMQHDNVTPPKRSREEMLGAGDGEKNQYKTPRISTSPARHTPGLNATDNASALHHTISMYRKQKPVEVRYTPVRQLICRPARQPAAAASPATPSVESPSVSASARIKTLVDLESSQLRIISQASVAVAVAEDRADHLGASHHVEAEKLLLLSTHRRMALLSEVQRVKTEASMCVSSWSQELDTSRGRLTISDISLPLSQDFLNKGIHDRTQHLVVLIKQREQVTATAVQSCPGCVANGGITFPDTVAVDSLSPDFAVTIEVHALKTPAPQHPGHLKKDPSRMKLTPLKRLHKNDHKSSPAVSSPGGPNAIKTSAFVLIGSTQLTIATLNRSAWALEKVPLSSPLSGHMMMRVRCTMEGGVSEKSFLTVFQDVTGFGAWSRRWAVLEGPHLKFWTYPDHEGRKDCVQCVPLRLVNTRFVETVSRDVCARANTFLLTMQRPTQAGDKNSLVAELQGNVTVTKLLLSADCAEERAQWSHKLNVALANIRAWDPEAVRPADYNV